MNAKQFFSIFSFYLITSLSAHINTQKEFFNSICAHPAIAELDWEILTEETKEMFYMSIEKKAHFIENNIKKMDLRNPKIFFKHLRKLQSKLAHTYPKPSKDFLQQWLFLNDNLENNINMSIQLLSINPQYASIFLTQPLIASGKRLNHPLILLFALLAGGDPNCQGDNNKNILNQVISDYKRDYSEKSVELLLLAGANPNIKTGLLQETALHHAAYIKNRCIMHTLLEYGANPYATNQKMQTPRTLITMSQRFPHTNLNCSSRAIQKYFTKNKIDNKESFKYYCKEIEEDFVIAEDVFSIIQRIQ